MIPAMQHSKEYYESLIRVIDCLASGRKEISGSKPSTPSPSSTKPTKTESSTTWESL